MKSTTRVTENVTGPLVNGAALNQAAEAATAVANVSALEKAKQMAQLISKTISGRHLILELQVI